MLSLALFTTRLFALGHNIDQTVAALEIETYAHSGSSPSMLNTKGLIVSNGGVEKEDYIHVLTQEKYQQDFVFLTVFGITEVEIAPSGTQFAVQELTTAPTQLEVETCVNALKNVLRSRKLHVDTILGSDIATRIWNLPTDAQQINAARKLRETVFLVRNYDAMMVRFAGPQDIDYRDKPYTNRHQTRNEEMNAVFEHLFGRERPDRYQFNLAELDFQNLFNRGQNNEGFPVKLTIPHDQVDKILDLASDSQKGVREDRREFANAELSSFYKTLNAQIMDYATFNNRVVDIPDENLDDVLQIIRRCQDKRKLALEQYYLFRMGVRDLNTNALLFDIYLHDPEGRSLYVFNDIHAQPFESTYDATRFAKTVIKAFKEVPRVLYSDRLQDVNIYRAGPNQEIAGKVSHDARSMMLIDADSSSSIGLIQTVRHEIAHVCDVKLGRALMNAMRDISMKYAPTVPKALKQMHRVIRQEALADGNLHFVEMSDIAYTRGMNAVIAMMGFAKATRHATYRFLRFEDKIALGAFRMQLVRKRNRYDALFTQFHRAMLSNDVLPGFSSAYGTVAATEDIAELLHSLVGKTGRQVLFTRSADDSQLLEKINAVIDTFSTVDGYTEMGWAWKKELQESTTRISRGNEAMAVVLPTDASVSDVRAAETYVGTKVSEGHNVSLLTVSNQGDIDVVIMSQNPSEDGHIIIFGARNNAAAHRKFRKKLESSGLGLDGRSSLCVEFAFGK